MRLLGYGVSAIIASSEGEGLTGALQLDTFTPMYNLFSALL